MKKPGFTAISNSFIPENNSNSQYGKRENWYNDCQMAKKHQQLQQELTFDNQMKWL